MTPRPGLPTDDDLASLRQSLLASETRFRNIIERNADGVIVVRLDGTICFVNPAAVALLARPASDLVGRPFGIPVVPGETTEIDIPKVGGEVQVAELRVVETEWEGVPALLVSLRDVSERKRLEEQLRQKAEELAEADRRKDEFLAMLAHELRNPLAPILNAVHVMRLRAEDGDLLKRMRDVVERQVRAMAHLVDDLLDVSRITRGKIQLRKEPVDLSSLVRHAVETARPLLDAKEHRFSLTLPGRPVRLHADPLRIEQILINLLNNAAKYTDPGGTIELRAALEPGSVALRVRDNGIGIAPEMVPRVFDLFAQADRSLDRSQGGLGIGLTLVRCLVQQHGGSVECQSAGMGQGSEFLVRLPVREEEPSDEPDPGAGSDPEPVSPVRRRYRVLVIDDNAHAAESLALIVRLWGHDARIAHSGPEALEVAPGYEPEVVLLDIGLPGMDGYSVGRRLRETPGLSDVFLVAITGYGRDEDRRRSREAGFDHHLLKPLDLDLLEKLIEDHART